MTKKVKKVEGFVYPEDCQTINCAECKVQDTCPFKLLHLWMNENDETVVEECNGIASTMKESIHYNLDSAAGQVALGIAGKELEVLLKATFMFGLWKGITRKEK